MRALACAALLASAAPLRAQEPIQDNSFLVEEAYNQERGIVQHISAFARFHESGDWIYTFTQEWPVPDQRHQLSYSLPVERLESPLAAATGIGDVSLNYRYQAMGIGGRAVAFAPRLSLLLPTGQSSRGLGSGGYGVQVNLPLSWIWTPKLVTHWNAGVTRTFSAKGPDGSRVGTTALTLGQSFVWLAKPKLNLLLETSFARAQEAEDEGRAASSDALYFAPGVRWAHDFSNGLQVVPGLAMLLGVGPSRGERAVFVYLSFEHAFRKAR